MKCVKCGSFYVYRDTRSWDYCEPCKIEEYYKKKKEKKGKKK